jgi:hypothetical protein
MTSLTARISGFSDTSAVVIPTMLNGRQRAMEYRTDQYSESIALYHGTTRSTLNTYVKAPMPQYFIESFLHESNVTSTASRPPLGALDQDKLSRQLRRLSAMTSVGNWDDEGGAAIPAQRWDKAREFCIRAAASFRGLPQPSVSPCGDGDIHITWTRADRRRFVLEIGADGLTWSLTLPGGIYETGVCESEYDALKLIGQHLA